MSKSLSIQLLSQLGIIGSADASSSIVPPARNYQSTLRRTDDFLGEGTVENPDVWSRYSAIVQRPVSYEAMLNLWQEMSDWDLMTAALSELTYEVIQADDKSPGQLWYESNNSEVESRLNTMTDVLGVEEKLGSQVWHLAALGNNFEKLQYSVGEGVTNMAYVHPKEVRRYWLERSRRCIGFRWSNHTPDKEPAFTGLDNATQIQRSALSFNGSVEDLYYPWDFMHIRRLFRLRLSEHGEPIFEEAQGIYKKLRMALDQLVVHRAQVQPDRYVFEIDVKDQPPSEQYQTVQRWRRSLRMRQGFGQGSGLGTQLSDPTAFTSFHNPMALDTIFYLPKPTGYAHAINKIGGTQTIPDVYDVEMLIDLFFSIVGMPKSWFGLSKNGQDIPSGRALLAQDIRFLRKVKSIRRPILTSYTWLGYLHAVLIGANVENLEIKAKMSDITSLEDQLKLEVFQLQAEVLSALGQVMEQYNLPREAWIDLVFKRYLHLPDEIVYTFMTALPREAESAVQEVRKAAPPPPTARLISEVERAVEASPYIVERVRRLKESAQVLAITREPARSSAKIPRHNRHKGGMFKLPAWSGGDRARCGPGKDECTEALSASSPGERLNEGLPPYLTKYPPC